MDFFHQNLQEHSSHASIHTYLDFYEKIYSKKLQEIDLFLKTSEWENYTHEQVSCLLDLNEKEVCKIMTTYNIESIDQKTFFIIMEHGSSEICKLFSREVERKLPIFYSLDDISYIYNIPYEALARAAYKANLSNITSKNIPTLFSYIKL
jgi:hypothetical protein